MATQPIEAQQAGHRRREFLVSSLGGFLLGFTIDGGTRAAKAAGVPAAETAVNAYVRIGIDNTITILFGGCEMGQGTMSGLAQVIAEDLMVDWNQIKVETALASPISYLTGGSSGVRGRYQTLRLAGATARDMLIAAAAKTWGVAESSCYATKGTVVHGPTKNTLTYGSLADLAAKLPVPTNPALVPESAFRLIGKPIPRLDIPSKTDGSAIYGIDVRVPGMVYAVVKHCPTLGGTLAATPAVPAGAIAVVPLKASDTRGAVKAGMVNAVAVVASNTWKAMQIMKELQVSWTKPASTASVDSAAIATNARALLATGTPLVAESVGDVNAALLSAKKVIDNVYTFPYLAHGTMEPLACTADVKADRCEVWAPNQAANWVLGTAMAVTGLPADKIIVHTTLLGGGLGRKIEQDYVSHAIQVSKAIGKPVKVTWPKEQDLGNDQYRPMAVVRVRAGLDGNGNVVGFACRNVSPSILGQRGWLPPNVADSQATEGITHLPYEFGSRLAEWVKHPAGVPVGFWRSVGHSINAYAVECAMDELAQLAGVDPIVYRRKLMANEPRAKAVLDAAADASLWRNSLPAGHAWGVAFAESFNSMVCQVVEVSAPVAGALQVHRVVVAVDCGYAVNPNSVEAQMQGGVVHGLASILWGQVTFKAGAASARNFSNNRALLLREMPKVQVVIVNSGTPTGGTGEPAVPPIGPAVANAYARLTGKWVRALPMFPAANVMTDD